ncbi:hypothetical protein [Phyllobacterium phragmitis]|uniref:hypothetical protein n=1 Tax=Phyllobacterium phragmitis TaxID=2670329 RepID=UPI0018EB10D9|nr:hypothetical protein [Phyllobacterium phragmitis]
MTSFDRLPQLALSVIQPWGHAIVHDWKDIENRSKPTSVRGPVCIHASRFVKRTFNGEANAYLQTVAGLDVPQFAFDDLTFGAIIGTVEIVDCVTSSPSRWFFGTYGYVLRNARSLEEPIPLKGALGFFDWRARLPADVNPARDEPGSPAQGSLF